MRKSIIFVSILLLLTISALYAQERGMVKESKRDTLPESTYRTSWALLVGINKYPKLPVQCQLSYAVNDVQAVKKLLIEQYQFPESNVITLTDDQATRQRIVEAMGQLTDRNKVDPQDRVIVYFSGHGQTIPLPDGGEMGYILPHDANVNLDDVENPSPYYTTCLGMDELKRLSRLIPAKHVLFLMDACYSGLAVSSRSGLQPTVPDYLRKVAILKSRQIITAGLRGDKSYEDPNWGHGAFTYKLLESLRTGVADGNADGVITGMELATHLRNVVPNISPDQTPHYGYFEGEGEFLFLRQTVAGILTVESIPLGARVVLAGKDQGRTPLKLELDPGRYMLELKEESYASWSGEIEIRSGDSTRISQKLTPEFGMLDVRVHPEGAKILVDGEESGITPSTLRLSSGTHRVEVKHRDYGSLTESVLIEPGQTRTLSGTLLQTTYQPGDMIRDESIKEDRWGDIITPAKVRMALDSLLFPGLGQLKGGRDITGIIFMSTAVGATASVVISYIQYEQSLDKYNDSISRYRNANTPDAVKSAKQAMIKAHDDSVKKYRFRNGAFIVTGSIWTLNLLHALIVGPAKTPMSSYSELRDRDIVPYITPYSIAMSASYRF